MHLLSFTSEPWGGFTLFAERWSIHLHKGTLNPTHMQCPVMKALESFTNHNLFGIHHSCPDMTSRSITVTVTLPLTSASLTQTLLLTRAYMQTRPPTHQSCDAYIFTPPHYKYHYVWLYLLPSHRGWRWPTLITLIKTEMCVFLCGSVWVCGAWLHPDGSSF